MERSIFDGYTRYTTPAEVRKSAVEDSQLGDVGTSFSFSISWSWSLSWTFTWSF